MQKKNKMRQWPGSGLKSKSASKTPRITFLVHDNQKAMEPGTTCQKLASACVERDWKVSVGCIDSLALLDNLPCWNVSTNASIEWQTPEDTDLLWVLTLGHRASFLDKMQLLALAEKTIPIINSPAALVFWHGKYLPASLHLPGIKAPETMASSEPDWLWSEMNARGGEWVTKPPGGSHGHQVYKMKAHRPEDFATLQASANGKYCLIQRYIPEIAQGEKRILLAGKQIVGQYLRIPTADFRTNLALGAQAKQCDLSINERISMCALAQKLCSEGILFSGVDLCWPWLIEINIINPGGMETIEELSGQDLSGKVLDAVTTHLVAP